MKRTGQNLDACGGCIPADTFEYLCTISAVHQLDKQNP
jgi:hypothetical protein